MRIKLSFLSILSGLSAAISFNFPGFSFLVWVAFIPLFWVISQSNYRQSFIYSFIAGIVHFLVVIFWVGFVTRLGLFLLVIYLGLYWGIFGLGCRRFVSKPGGIAGVGFLWIGLEYLRTNLGGFGWSLLGYSQYRNLLVIQVSDIFGVWAVSFLIICINFILYNIIISKQKTKKFIFGQFLTGFCLFGICLFYGWFSLRQGADLNNSLVVSLVQPNISQEEKWDPLSGEKIKGRLKYLGQNSDKSSLVVFPESSWPDVLRERDIKQVHSFSKSIDRDIILGTVIREGLYFYNTAILQERNKPPQIYKKLKLVPFGEYVPFRNFLTFIDVFNSLGDMRQGQEYILLEYKQAKVAVLICFEDTFPGLARNFILKGANILLNITNDAWFKGNPQSLQHLQTAVFRAIENRKSLVRVANTGISCIISPLGEVLNRVSSDGRDLFIQGGITDEVFLNKQKSLYSRLGDVLVFIGMVYLVIYFIIIGLSYIKR
jgi:apolipoprotein N-acyltransferase